MFTLEDCSLPQSATTNDLSVEVALLVLETLDNLGLRPLVKTTGGKGGLHTVVPIVRYAFAQRLRRATTRLAETAIDPGRTSSRPSFTQGHARWACWIRPG
jgi:DNA primase